MIDGVVFSLVLEDQNLIFQFPREVNVFNAFHRPIGRNGEGLASRSDPLAILIEVWQIGGETNRVPRCR